jgi:hypothetical protein
MYMKLVLPGSEFKDEELHGGGITAVVKVCILEEGSFLLAAEVVNEGRSASFE